MRVIIQKVSQASVTVDNNLISQIKKGYFLLVGISVNDTEVELERIAKKICGLRLFELNEDDILTNLWKKSIKDVKGEILSVSQFTLYAKTKKGTKPDFHRSQKSEIAQPLYEKFLAFLRKELGNVDLVKDGQFGGMMSCALTNEGPCTIILDTDETA
ncbi:probable D-tyrosyl-tRNA(Tyr) deacylase [Hanseniaspora guilliermondii]|uniref:D-aminoacyl-tRNA deacylase n=1 Tax=Hanseniaspora guilliermondii TaxID=56406 RepID=A0A1L0CRP2_9ASCO|nr:probable D-tyrosyl-tRNA(Tyr) deacylase [Hanseniaspora guilliermondii]